MKWKTFLNTRWRKQTTTLTGEIYGRCRVKEKFTSLSWDASESCGRAWVQYLALSRAFLHRKLRPLSFLSALIFWTLLLLLGSWCWWRPPNPSWLPVGISHLTQSVRTHQRHVTQQDARGGLSRLLVLQMSGMHPGEGAIPSLGKHSQAPNWSSRCLGLYARSGPNGCEHLKVQDKAFPYSQM